MNERGKKVQSLSNAHDLALLGGPGSSIRRKEMDSQDPFMVSDEQGQGCRLATKLTVKKCRSLTSRLLWL